MSRPEFEPPTSCRHSSKELSRQIITSYSNIYCTWGLYIVHYQKRNHLIGCCCNMINFTDIWRCSMIRWRTWLALFTLLLTDILGGSVRPRRTWLATAITWPKNWYSRRFREALKDMIRYCYLTWPTKWYFRKFREALKDMIGYWYYMTKTN